MTRTQLHVDVTSDAFHLPGKHSQRSHGNRKGRVETPKSALDPPVNDLPNSITGTRVMSQDEFNRRVLSASTGGEVASAVPISTDTDLNAALESELSGVVTREDARDAYSFYTHSGYVETNSELRASDGDVNALTGELRNIVTVFDDVMAVSSTTDDVVVYRGIKDPRMTFGNAFSLNVGANVDLTWRDEGYSSTTTSSDIAEGFSGTTGGVLLRILAPSGTKMTGTPYSSAAGEDEYIINRGASYRAVADYIDDYTGVRTFDVEVVM